ncbi:MAG: LysE family translocator [Deltaproteobacteria bacterium]|nr:LysE family translocator [Candidatus Anaeroferrophillus wilburensis]MBN2888215.1 LysE family translocator [Deltaproteobacteria bacterium]
MNTLSLVSFSVAMLILAASPGPGVAATVSRSLASGFHSALAVIAGIVMGDLIYLLFVLFGLSLAAQTLGKLFIVVKIGGGAYLFWLGITIWRAKPHAFASSAPQSKDARPTANLISGLLVTLANPKVIVFYCGFLPTFIDLSSLQATDAAMIAGIVAIVLSGVLIVYAAAATYARRLFSSHKAIGRLNRSAVAVMMAAGIAIAAKQ